MHFIMKINSILLIMLLVAGSMIELSAYKPSNSGNSKQVSQQAAPRGSCSPATKQIDMEINNVRARLLNGGDIWWDKSKGRYIVPKVVPGSGIPEVSALYAGVYGLGKRSIWRY